MGHDGDRGPTLTDHVSVPAADEAADFFCDHIADASVVAELNCVI